VHKIGEGSGVGQDTTGVEGRAHNVNITEEEIRDLLARYEAAESSHDFSRVAGMIHSNATFRFTDGDHEGIDAIQAAFEATWNTWDVKDERYYLTDVKVVTTDVQSAVITFTYNWSGEVEGESFSVRGRGTSVIVRNGDSFQFIYEHLSS
jgi:ketosteroid isomerase-like protein